MGIIWSYLNKPYSFNNSKINRKFMDSLSGISEKLYMD
jgi:hypothetical protein